jgi:RNA polymerase sigma-70 factor (ECF subfamily)
MLRLNELRRLRSVPKMAEFDGQEGVADKVVAHTDDPHDVYIKKLECQRVRAAIAQLPAEFREIVILREYEELSYQEIADILKCPQGTVMSRLARARSRLRVLLSVAGESPPSAKQQAAE